MNLLANKYRLNRLILKRKGSALLVALVFTGLLTLVTIGVSTLISRETRQARDIIDGTKAFYGAEAGIELALLDLQENSSGFEVSEGSLNEFSDEAKVSLRYGIKSLTNSVPILADFERKLIRDNVLDQELGFAELKLNQTITIPFTNNLKRFVLEYYYPLADQLQIPNLSSFDVLRWKLFGKNSEGGIDSLNDFIPASNEDGVSGLDADAPATLGTEGKPNAYWDNGVFFPSDPNSTDAAGALFCDNSNTSLCMRIKDFIESHTDNHLVITNLLDTSRIPAGLNIDERQAASIFYRITDLENQNNISGRGELVSPTAKIKSIGSSNGREQSLEVEIAPDTFLPIFDFALFRPEI